MRQKIIAFLKKTPVLYPIIRYITGTVIQLSTGQRNTTFFSYKGNIQDGKAYQITKQNKKFSLYRDRLEELRSFFQLGWFRLMTHFIANGTPNTNYYQFKKLEHFEKIGTDTQTLKKAYESAAFMYTARLMLAYHNYDIGLKGHEIASGFLSLNTNALRVLDYGCGVADPSLILALLGAEVTIVDLDDPKLSFAESRFKKRGLEITRIATEQTESPVSLNGKYDFVILAEFLEHVRNPRLYLEHVLAHMGKDAILYDSLGPTHQYGIYGDHLKEAKEQIESTDYSDFHHAHLAPANKMFNADGFKHFYIRK